MSGKSSGRKRRRKNDRSLVCWMQYAAVRGVAAVLRTLPDGLGYRLAETFLRAVLLVAPRFVRRCREHVEIAFGDEQTDAWKDRVAATSFRYLAWYFADVLTAPRRLRRAEALADIDLTELREVFERDGIGRETGALLVSAHLGTPEIASLAVAASGWPNAVVVRKLDNGFLWDWVLREREHIPSTMITKDGALRAAYKIVRKKGLVGIQIDQDARSKGVFVPYFGRPASTSPGVAALALMCKAPVYMLYGVRSEPRAFRHRVHVSGPIAFEPTGVHDADAQAYTALMTAEIEKAARRFPEQVMWAHRRWKTKPPDPASGVRPQPGA